MKGGLEVGRKGGKEEGGVEGGREEQRMVAQMGGVEEDRPEGKEITASQMLEVFATEKLIKAWVGGVGHWCFGSLEGKKHAWNSTQNKFSSLAGNFGGKRGSSDQGATSKVGAKNGLRPEKTASSLKNKLDRKKTTKLVGKKRKGKGVPRRSWEGP